MQQKLFAMYDIEEVFVDSKALNCFQIAPESLRCQATLITSSELSLDAYDIVIEI